MYNIFYLFSFILFNQIRCQYMESWLIVFGCGLVIPIFRGRMHFMVAVSVISVILLGENEILIILVYVELTKSDSKTRFQVETSCTLGWHRSFYLLKRGCIFGWFCFGFWRLIIYFDFFIILIALIILEIF